MYFLKSLDEFLTIRFEQRHEPTRLSRKHFPLHTNARWRERDRETVNRQLISHAPSAAVLLFNCECFDFELLSFDDYIQS